MASARRKVIGPASNQSLYEVDFYAWALEQAELIRTGKLDRADLPNLAEEIESLGKEQAAKLRSSYRLIAIHFLKLAFQPGTATNSWRATVAREPSNVDDLLSDSPGLKPRRGELFAKAYSAARREAAAETGLPSETFPATSPFNVDQIEERHFWP